jgi:hypothetical protein
VARKEKAIDDIAIALGRRFVGRVMADGMSMREFTDLKGIRDI